VLLQDYQLVEYSRIKTASPFPERIVHATREGANGTFTVTNAS
jgi:catalase